MSFLRRFRVAVAGPREMRGVVEIPGVIDRVAAVRECVAFGREAAPLGRADVPLGHASGLGGKLFVVLLHELGLHQLRHVIRAERDGQVILEAVARHVRRGLPLSHAVLGEAGWRGLGDLVLIADHLPGEPVRAFHDPEAGVEVRAPVADGNLTDAAAAVGAAGDDPQGFPVRVEGRVPVLEVRVHDANRVVVEDPGANEVLGQRIGDQSFDVVAVRGDLDFLPLADRPLRVVGHADVGRGVRPLLDRLSRPLWVNDLPIPVYGPVGGLAPDQDVRSAVDRINGRRVFPLLDREGEERQLFLIAAEGCGHTAPNLSFFSRRAAHLSITGST